MKSGLSKAERATLNESAAGIRELFTLVDEPTDYDAVQIEEKPLPKELKKMAVRIAKRYAQNRANEIKEIMQSDPRTARNQKLISSKNAPKLFAVSPALDPTKMAPSAEEVFERNRRIEEVFGQNQKIKEMFGQNPKTREIIQGIAAMPEKFGELFVAHYLEGQTSTRIAQESDRQLGMVRNDIQILNARLRRLVRTLDRE